MSQRKTDLNVMYWFSPLFFFFLFRFLIALLIVGLHLFTLTVVLGIELVTFFCCCWLSDQFFNQCVLGLENEKVGEAGLIRLKLHFRKMYDGTRFAFLTPLTPFRFDC